MTSRNKTVLLAVWLVVSTGILGEATWRFVQLVQNGTSFTTLLPGYRERRFVQSPFLPFGPRIDWQIPGRSNVDTAYFNPQGFRTRDIIGRKSVGETRIIAIGGSTTEDVWNENGLHWPLLLERTLADSGHDHAKVYNAGMSAYSSAHDLIRLSFDVLDYEPDLVLMMHNINDLTVNYYAALAGQAVDPHYLVAFGQKRFTGQIDESDIVLSRLANSVELRLQAWTQSDAVVPESYNIDLGERYFARNLATIHTVVADRGSQLVLLTMPVCDDEEIYRQVEFNGRRQFSSPLPRDFQRFIADFSTYNDVIRHVAVSRNIPLIDMARLFGGSKEHFADFVHYNADGSERFAEILAAELESLVARVEDGSIVIQ